MKTVVLLICITLCCLQNIFAQISSKVDERFELTSIVFRLAGATEYNQCGVPTYATDIGRYFASMMQHPLISYIKQIRNSNNISYNAVSASTALLEIQRGNVQLKPQYALTDITTYESRWSESLFKQYIYLLNDFYRQSNFKQFFEQHSVMYELATSRMDDVLKQLQTEWFVSFFGSEFRLPNVYISMCNGPSNYALPGNMPQSSYGVVIGTGSDNEGLPLFTSGTLSIIVHELVHRYTSPILEVNWVNIQPAAEIIYPYVKEQMARLAYNNARDMTGEWLTNLFMLMYYRERTPNMVTAYSASLQEQGFIWMDRSVEFMCNFYNNRKIYPSICNFTPQIIGFINFVATHISQVSAEFTNRQPYITNTYPAIGSVLPHDSSIQQIVITFSQPMNTEAHGLRPCEQSNITVPPVNGNFSWQDPYTYIIGLTSGGLQSGQTYGVTLLGGNFISAKGYSMGENINIFFKTTEEK